ncbi:MAG TPA: hypothetical protein VL944_01850 [Candidatus Acidoferrum sp.]|nr:hypothetical protein [Candidatus Acidoferrum sp.]
MVDAEVRVHEEFREKRSRSALKVVSGKGDPLLLLFLRFPEPRDGGFGNPPPLEREIAHVNYPEMEKLEGGVGVGVIRPLVLTSKKTKAPKEGGGFMSFHDLIDPRLHRGRYFFVRGREDEVIEYLSSMIVTPVTTKTKKTLRAIFQDKSHGLTKEEVDKLFELKQARDAREQRLPALSRKEDAQRIANFAKA